MSDSGEISSDNTPKSRARSLRARTPRQMLPFQYAYVSDAAISAAEAKKVLQNEINGLHDGMNDDNVDAGLKKEADELKLIPTKKLIYSDPSSSSPEFVEPPIEKSLSVTGQPLEDPPSIKLKREAFSGKKKKINKANKLTDVKDDDMYDTVEGKYRLSLNTTDSETITKPSIERSKTTPVPKKGALTKPIVSDEPKTPRKRQQQTLDSTLDKNNNTSKMLKRVKQSPKKKTADFGFGIPKIKEPTVEIKDEDPTMNNQDYCASCGLTGLFLCCESCPKSFHFYCLNPPVDESDLPDQWFCNECKSKKVKITLKKKNHTGIFSKLLDNLESKNPLAFRLPREISEAFEGVSISKEGDYQDDDTKPIKSYKQILQESEDPLFEVYDKEGNPYFCYKCGGSGLNNKQLTKCDYCDLIWHLDCLGLPSAKKLGKKWMCPNHTATVVRPKRKLRKQPIVEIDLTRGFQTSDDANLEIITMEEIDDNCNNNTNTNGSVAVDDGEDGEEFKVTPVVNFSSESGSSRATPAYPDHHLAQKQPQVGRNNEDEESFVEDSDELERKLPVDPIFQYRNSDTSLLYTVPKHQQCCDTAELKGNVTFQLKEESIILDFIKGSKIRKVEELKQQDQEMLNHWNSDEKESNFSDGGLKDYLIGLSKLSQRELISENQKRLNLNELMKVTNDEYNIENETFTKDELRELTMVKKLMELKGTEKLMKFLKS